MAIMANRHLLPGPAAPDPTENRQPSVAHNSLCLSQRLLAGDVEAGAGEVIFSFAFADPAGIAAVGAALGLPQR
jgi:hypothetical protein